MQWEVYRFLLSERSDQTSDTFPNTRAMLLFDARGLSHTHSLSPLSCSHILTLNALHRRAAKPSVSHPR